MTQPDPAQPRQSTLLSDPNITAAQDEQTSLLQLLLRHNFSLGGFTRQTTSIPTTPPPPPPKDDANGEGERKEEGKSTYVSSPSPPTGSPEHKEVAAGGEHELTPGQVTAQILGTETRMIERRRHTVYKILVNRGTAQWWRFHRYQEFRELRIALRPYAYHSLPVFPGRKWWFTDNFSAAFVNQRRAGLSMWLAGVMEDERLLRAPPLHQFLDDGHGSVFGAEVDELGLGEGIGSSQIPLGLSVSVATATTENGGVGAKGSAGDRSPKKTTSPPTSPAPSSITQLSMPQPTTGAPVAQLNVASLEGEEGEFHGGGQERKDLWSGGWAVPYNETGQLAGSSGSKGGGGDEELIDWSLDGSSPPGTNPSSGTSTPSSPSSPSSSPSPLANGGKNRISRPPRAPMGHAHHRSSRPRAGSAAGRQRQHSEVNRKRAKSRVQVTGLDDFTLLRVVGSGSYGKVMLARHKASGKVYAVKALSKKHLAQNPQEALRVMSERNVLKSNVQHPFLLGLRYSFQSAHKLYFCVDYVNGGELFFHLQKEGQFSEERVRFYTMEMVSALEYLHSRGYVYRDLKPENCLLDSEGHVRIVDFGLAKHVTNQAGGQTSTFCGTPEYLAPEVLLQQPYGQAVDWYCLGTLVYEMLVGLPPFYSQDHAEMYQKILHDKLRFPRSIHPAAKAFCTRMLDRRPERRLGSGPDGAAEIRAHPFFEGIEWERVRSKGYQPPFKPKVEGTMDLRNFDPEFTGEKIPRSMLLDARQHGTGLSMALAEKEANDGHGNKEPDVIEFPGFSYDGGGEGALGGGGQGTPKGYYSLDGAI